jgi:SAM-dependent methyltransferase
MLPNAVMSSTLPSPGNRFAFEEVRIAAAYRRRERLGLHQKVGPAQALQRHEAERELRELLRSYRIEIEKARILEAGCGSGDWLCTFSRWGARPENLFGVDLLPQRIEKARQLCPHGITLECGSAAQMDFPGQSFDLVLQSTMFSSILDAGLRRRIAQEMLRVLRPGGLVLWYDFFVNNPGNPDVRGVGRREIRRLFPACDVRLKKLTLAPPLGRKVVRLSPSLHGMLSRIRLLCTHYLGIISPGRETA